MCKVCLGCDKGWVNTHTDIGTERYINFIGQIGRPTGIETTNLIGLGFSQIRLQSEF